MVLVANHKSGCGKRDYNHERKIQDAYVAIGFALFCRHYWVSQLMICSHMAT